MGGFHALPTGETGPDLYSEVGLLRDINLKTFLNSRAAPFTIELGKRHAIYKVILYAENTEAAISDWKVATAPNDKALFRIIMVEVKLK